MNKYVITLSFDGKRKINITTCASSIEQAKRIVLNSEKAPERAIVNIKEIKS